MKRTREDTPSEPANNKQKKPKHTIYDTQNVFNNKPIIPVRTLHMIAIQKATIPDGINGVTNSGKQQLATATSNFAQWLIHVAAACALRRIQIQHSSPTDSTDKKKKKKKKKYKSKVKSIRQVQVLKVDVEEALVLIASDASIAANVPQHVPVTTDEPSPRPTVKTVATSFLQSNNPFVKSINTFFIANPVV